ncbi:MAG: TonB-dependent receptor [Chitinophagales bacterium]
MKKSVLFIVFVFTALSTLFAQDATLSGVVLDEDNEPLFGVNVVIDAAQGWAGATDFDGKYTVSVPAGTYYVLYTAVGQENQIKEVTLAAGEKRNIDISLKEKEILIGDVEIVGTKRGLTLEQEVVSVEVLSSDMLSNNNMTNGAEAVDKVPGVTVLDGQASIRGGSGYAYGVGSRVILVIDGIPLLSPERSEVLWDFIPMENVESMEVIKGASSVQYGSSALNGIINVNTGWAKKKKETEITMFGTIYDNPPSDIEDAKWWDYSIQNFREDPHELGFNMVHRRKLNDEMDFVIGGTMHSNQSHIQSQSIHKIRNQIKWRWRPEKIEGLTLEVNSNTFFRNKDVFFIWDGYGEGSYQGQSYQDKYVRFNVDPKIKYFFKEKNSIEMLNRVYYDKRVDSDYFSTSIYNDIKYTRTYKKDKVNGAVNVGVVNTSNTIKGPSFSDFSKNGDSKFKYNNFGAYAQTHIGYKGLTVTAGARFDWISLDDETQASRPVFNAGASYKFNKANVVRFNFGQSFRIAGIAERFVFEEITSLGSTPVYAGPNPDIQPESGYSMEIGYKRLLKFGKWQGMADAAVFYQDFKDMTEFTFSSAHVHPVDSSTFWGFKSLNISDAKIFGWEMSISGTGKIRKIPVSILAGYTYNYGVNAEENPEASKMGKVIGGAFKAFKVTEEDYQTISTPESSLYGVLRYRFRHTVKLDLSADFGPLTLGTNMRYYSFIDQVDDIFALAIPDIAEYRSSRNYKGDFVVDMRAFYRVNDNFQLGLIVKNIANNNYQIRPAKPDANRTFTVQGKVNF